MNLIKFFIILIFFINNTCFPDESACERCEKGCNTGFNNKNNSYTKKELINILNNKNKYNIVIIDKIKNNEFMTLSENSELINCNLIKCDGLMPKFLASKEDLNNKLKATDKYIVMDKNTKKNFILGCACCEKCPQKKCE